MRRKEATPSHLSNPLLDKPEGSAGALHGVLGFLQRRCALPKVPHHVLHLALHSMSPAPTAGGGEGRQENEQPVNEEMRSSTHQLVQESILPAKTKKGALME